MRTHLCAMLKSALAGRERGSLLHAPHSLQAPQLRAKAPTWYGPLVKDGPAHHRSKQKPQTENLKPKLKSPKHHRPK